MGEDSYSERVQAWMSISGAASLALRQLLVWLRVVSKYFRRFERNRQGFILRARAGLEVNSIASGHGSGLEATARLAEDVY